MAIRKGIVLLLGPSLNNRGGMAVSEKLILEGWSNRSFPIELLVTHHDGSALKKTYVFLWALLKYVFRLAFTDVSLVHIFFVSGPSFYRKSVFIILAKLFRKKVLLNCRLGNFDEFHHNSSPIIKKIIRYILSLSDGVVVLGNKERDFFVKECNIESCAVIHNSIFCPPSFAKFDKSPTVICTMGKLGQRKGTYDLLEAIPAILSEFPEVEFWICGDGEIEKVKQVVENKGLEKNVKLLGWVSGDEKEEIYLSTSIYVLPSYFEGMPRSILEAMSYGLPVIATNVNAIPELIEDGNTGILIEPGDANTLAGTVLKLLRDKQMRILMGQSARKSIQEKFDPRLKLAELERFSVEIILG